MEQKSKKKGDRVNVTFTKDQLDILDSLTGIIGSNRPDTVNKIVVMWLNEKYKLDELKKQVK